jgi:tetratricopeptide (TPR) repeat protein
MLKRILLGLACAAVLGTAWLALSRVKSGAEKQSELMAQAGIYISDKSFVSAIPLLEEAAAYRARNTAESEEMLKVAYRGAGDSKNLRKYTDLLDKQMAEKDASPAIYKEAADYYIETGKLTEALSALKNGVTKTNDENLAEFYEQHRYAYRTVRTAFEDVSTPYGGMVAVMRDGKWGLATYTGEEAVPCEYDKISAYSNGAAIVKRGDEIAAINRGNQQMALLKPSESEPDIVFTDFGNAAQNRVPVLGSNGKWKRANLDFLIGSGEFDGLGMYSEGYAAAKQGEKWGVVDLGFDFWIPAEYDHIIQDELGRCYGQGAVFAVKGGKVYLFVDGEQLPEAYEDARPFGAAGYAAVKKGGKWGFIDTEGQVKIECRFDDAASFSGHLAAVKQGNLWGYAALTGKIAIEPQFLRANPFHEGSAPVLAETGWQFISLVEYTNTGGGL